MNLPVRDVGFEPEDELVDVVVGGAGGSVNSGVDPNLPFWSQC
jgi:hypothetical protein